MALIEVNDLSVGQRLQDINLSLEPGEMLGIIGPNGSGKSTLLNSLAGVLDYHGQVELEGSELESFSLQQRAQIIGLLPQVCHSAWSLTVSDIISLGRIPWGDQNESVIEDAARQAGVESMMMHRVDRLSGGEQARVWLARVLAGEPKLLLADEPIASLDLYYQRKIMELLRQYAKHSRGVILSVHDLSLAARYCDKLCLLHKGRIYSWGTPAEVITETNMQTVFNIAAHVDLSANPPLINYK